MFNIFNIFANHNSSESIFPERVTVQDLERELETAPEKMSFASSEAEHSFNNAKIINQDYIVLMEFAENWARLMEKEMESGRKLNQKLVNECDRLADTKCGNSGASYNWARKLLLVHWKYGKELLTNEQKKMYGRNPDMVQFYTKDTKVKEYLERKEMEAFDMSAFI